MKSTVKFIFFILFSFIILNCKTHKDETLDKALFAYIAGCYGGSISACRSACVPQCGVASETDPINNTLYPCVSNCHTNCSSSCDTSTILLYLSNK